jgi:EAL domain-containing protein (putative c-di-GMP-specific phosphodiesterase class I)
MLDPRATLATDSVETINMRQASHWTIHALASALGRNEFVPFFQPKFDLITGMSRCVEVLARWDHPERGLLLPSRFIESIEQAGLMAKFTESLVEKSLASLRKYAEKGNGSEIGMAFNLTPSTLSNPRAMRAIVSLVQQYAVPFDKITIEVTETTVVKNYAAVFDALHRLRMQGFQISIDDFGMGYSSLKLLSQMPFTEMKIDRTFIAGLRANCKVIHIVDSMVSLAKNLHMGVVAEGIETESELESIQAFRFDFGQGFHFDSPARELEQLHITATPTCLSTC